MHIKLKTKINLRIFYIYIYDIKLDKIMLTHTVHAIMFYNEMCKDSLSMECMPRSQSTYIIQACFPIYWNVFSIIF